MPASPSQAKPPGDDFVLWPESLGQSPGPVNEAAIRRSLAGLAPTEWVEDHPSEESTEAGKPGLAGNEERFYPASRQWFRTTTAIPAADATEKWWQQVPAAPQPAVSELLPSPPSEPPDLSASTVSSELLSPEEIWEMASRELEQASRLGARPAVSASAPAGKAVYGPDGEPPGPAHSGSPPPATLTEPVVTPMAQAPVMLVSGEPSAVVTAVDLPEIPGSEPAGAVALPESRLPEGITTELPVVAAAAPVGRPAAELSAWVQLPPSEAAVEREEGTEAAAELPEAPVMAFPKPAVPAAADCEPVLPAAACAAPASPAVASVEAAPVVLGAADPLVELSGPVPLDPLPAIPAARLPLSLRREKSRTPLRLPRRQANPGSAGEPVFAGLGGGSGDSPVTDEEVIAAEGAAADAAPPAEERRRRTRRERRPLPEPAPSRRRWLGWCVSTLALLAMMAAVVTVVTGDQLPAAWRHSVERWWQKGQQFLFPHQYGYSRRGVVPRAGQAPGIPTVPPGATTAAANSSPPAGSLPPPVLPPSSEPPAAAKVDSSRDALPPPPLPLVESTRPAAPIPGPPPSSKIDTAEAKAPPAPAGEITAPRAEPVPEDEGEIVADDTPADVVPVVPENTPEIKSPEAMPASGAAPEGGATAGSPSSGAFTLWDGDDPPEPEGSPASDGALRQRETLPEATTAAVAQGKIAVQSLVEARSAAEVLPWIFDSGPLEKAVRSYYDQYPLQPLMDAVIEHEYSGIIPATGGKAHIFNVLAASHPRGFPVSAEATPQGYRIDWQTYIQWRDGWLQRFLDSKSDTPQTLFVILRRTHYFNDDVPQLDKKLAFKLTSAVPDDEGAVAFVDKNSAVGRSLAGMYEWRTMYFPVVELQWVPDGRNGRYLRLNRIVRPTWRRIGE